MLSVSAMTQPTVLIIQRRLTHYRVAFFEALRIELVARGYRLALAYGEGTEAEQRKKDSATIDWAVRLPTRYYLGAAICWQPFGKLARDAALTVVTQENKLIYNTWAQFAHRRGRLAFWGHGGNLQGDPKSWKELAKRLLARRVDWWFAYTQLSVPLIKRSGFPVERITVLENSVDTSELAAMRSSVTPISIANLKRNLGVQSDQVGIYIGSLYRDKRIEFLLKAAVEIRRRVPDFELLIVGNGPLDDIVAEFCASHPWAKQLGVRQGQAKVDAMALAKVMLIPSAVGLALLDSFVCGVPLVTTEGAGHGPEIAYLEPGSNGLMTRQDTTEYADAAAALLEDECGRILLSRQCLEAAKRYSIANMVRRFADGVDACLSVSPYRWKEA
jgi:L-malate glycosyltransferase